MISDLDDAAGPLDDPALSVEITQTGRSAAEAFRSSHATQVLTILMTDLEGSTKQQSELGNIRAAQVTQEHRRLFRELLAKFDGQEVETAGDAFLVVFAAPSEGVRFALHMQAAMADARKEHPDLPPVRVGLHQGQVVVERHGQGDGTGAPGKPMDIYGVQVSTAARITDLAQGGQMLCTRAVFDDARAILRRENLEGLRDVAWINHGPFSFKGVPDPYDVCEVGETGRAPLQKPSGSTKSHPAEEGDVIYGWRPGPDAAVPHSQWRLEAKLGEGGFGEVWLARDKDQPARKTVFKFCTKRSKVKSLRREKDVFDHLVDDNGKPLPGIAQVMGAHDDTEGGEPPYYIELAYCPGGDLRQWIDAHAKDAPMRVKLDVVLQMTRALGRIHERGYVHRDVKPSNYLLEAWDDPNRAPDLNLSDFGIGQEVLRDAIGQGQSTGELAGGGGRYTLHSETLSQAAGTFLFIAPELVVRRESTPGKVSRQADYKADIYSLGVSLYQLFAGSTEAVPGPGLRELDDPILREDVEACLDPDPENRPRAEELAERLEQYDARMAEREAAIEGERLRKRNRRFAFIAGVAALVAVVGLSFGGVALWQWRLADEERERAQVAQQAEKRQRLETEKQEELAKTQRDKAEEQAYFTNILLARKQIDEFAYDSARETLWRCSERLRDFEWGVLVSRLMLPVMVLPEVSTIEESLAHPDFVYHDALFSPDGKQILAVSPDYGVRIWNIESGHEVTALFGLDDAVEWAAFSPEGEKIVTAHVSGVARIFDVAGGKVLLVLNGHGARINRATFSPDGTRLISASDDGTARVWDAVTGKEMQILRGEGPKVSRASFSSDGAYILTASGTARVWDAVTGEPLRTLVNQETIDTAMFSPDCSLVVTSSFLVQRARVWDVQTAKEVAVLDNSDGVTVASFSPNSKLIVTGCRDGSARIWDSRSGDCRVTLKGHARSVTNASFDPTGTFVLTSTSPETRHQQDPNVRVWRVETGELVTMLEGHGIDSCVARWAPDGGRVVTQSDATRVWDLTSLYPSAVRIPDDQDVDQIFFDESGMRFVVWSTENEVIGYGDVLTGQACMLDDQIELADGIGQILQIGDRSWDLDPGRETPDLPALEQWLGTGNASPIDPVARVSSADGALVAIVPGFSYGPVVIWSQREDRLVVKLGEADREHYWRAAFSPDCHHVAVVTSECSIPVWNLNAPAEPMWLEGHTQPPRGVLFNPSGTRVISWAADETVRIWEPSSGRELLCLHIDAGELSISPQGDRLVAASQGSPVKIVETVPWRLDNLPVATDQDNNAEDEWLARLKAWKNNRYREWRSARPRRCEMEIS